MISRETEAILKRLLAGQPTYRPLPEIVEKISGTTFLCFVGATCMGKTTLMDTLAALDEQYGKTRNFTSRPPRADDDPKRYYYYEHSDAGLRPLLDRIERRENLQHNINPFSLYVYGTEAEDYAFLYNMSDIFASSIDGFRQLGYGKLLVFTVITDPDTWELRFERRFPLTNPERTARLKEAVASLEWSLAQSAPDHLFIIDPAGQIEVAAASVQKAVRGEILSDQAEARTLAEACLTRARGLLS